MRKAREQHLHTLGGVSRKDTRVINCLKKGPDHLIERGDFTVLEHLDTRRADLSGGWS